MTGTGNSGTPLLWVSIGMVIAIAVLLAGVMDFAAVPEAHPQPDVQQASQPQPAPADAMVQRTECPTIQSDATGETAAVETTPSGARITVAVQGPSAALLPHLTVTL